MEPHLREMFVQEYGEALGRIPPDDPRLAPRDGSAESLAQIISLFPQHLAAFDTGGAGRFQKPTDRPFVGGAAWTMSHGAGRPTLSLTYKGLLNHKTPFDLVLYAALIWELKPRTIIEFGSMQGGSALWLADQLQSMCGGGEVHSYDLLSECVSPRAKQAGLHFHSADLDHLETLDATLFRRLPHPWLVIDDAHTNVINLAFYMNEFISPGDYYIKEDIHLWSVAQAGELMRAMESKGFLVDTLYLDAFGPNMTSSPNAWFVKA